MAKIINKFPTFTNFFNEYSANFLTDDEKKDKVIKTAHTVIARGVYYYYRESDFFQEENGFYGEIFSRINTDSHSFAKSQQIFTNIILLLIFQFLYKNAGFFHKSYFFLKTHSKNFNYNNKANLFLLCLVHLDLE
ncbi:MAG: hypothetical protein I3273_05675 [Candidatus Moeniiplasma glomeromycotorum]|nr:hypothetical protein [Candidatus Moeniiplasma glomeromycotorum]MCE8168058.1 hypothetical protein [Candidatus Moeniiplasma glomeromycotorum]MCE8169575.1 hypothetical protein [Candidatus Moeniiplasma glomeromycotorum]